jgi:hypothetical protein
MKNTAGDELAGGAGGKHRILTDQVIELAIEKAPA